jgi:F0F1-type ATP synthase beta subunit
VCACICCLLSLCWRQLTLQVPVGRGTLGRIMNVIGEPVDECGPIGRFLWRVSLCVLTESC